MTNKTVKKDESDNELKKDDETKNSSSDSLSSIGDSLVDDMPEVQTHAVEAEKMKIEEEKKNVVGLTDRHGASFDPHIHVTNPDGTPSLTINNKLKRKPGRNSGGPSIVGGKTKPIQDKQESSQTVNSRAAAITTVDMLEMVGMMFAGDEWRYIKDNKTGLDERENGYTVFEDYYRSKGVSDIPPGVAVVIWGLLYAVPRFRQPVTQSKFQQFGNWVKMKILKRRLKKGPQVEQDKTEDK